MIAEVPEFNTPRLQLRGISEQDVDAYERHFVDYEVIRHLVDQVPWPYPEDGVHEHIITNILPNQGNGRWCWGIFLKEEPDELIGNVELKRETNPDNRGFWLGREYWGRGIMTEAVRPVLDYAFESLGFELLVFSNAAGNMRSRRIKEKTSARFLRVEPASFVDPQYTHREIWELTKKDWQSARAGEVGSHEN